MRSSISNRASPDPSQTGPGSPQDVAAAGKTSSNPAHHGLDQLFVGLGNDPVASGALGGEQAKLRRLDQRLRGSAAVERGDTDRDRQRVALAVRQVLQQV